jgi:hypothetical protein
MKVPATKKVDFNLTGQNVEAPEFTFGRFFDSQKFYLVASLGSSFEKVKATSDTTSIAA